MLYQSIYIKHYTNMLEEEIHVTDLETGEKEVVKKDATFEDLLSLVNEYNKKGYDVKAAQLSNKRGDFVLMSKEKLMPQRFVEC